MVGRRLKDAFASRTSTTMYRVRYASTLASHPFIHHLSSRTTSVAIAATCRQRSASLLQHPRICALHHPAAAYHSSAATASDNHAATSSSSSSSSIATTRPQPIVPSLDSPSTTNSSATRPLTVTTLLRNATALSLPRPGTIVPPKIRVPYKPRKPLPAKTQELIDSKLVALRSKEHPEWLEKRTVRKMTLQERQQLLTAQHQKWDIEKFHKLLSKCNNPLASIQYIDRAHDWFLRIYTHASLSVYNQMLLSAGRFHQYSRVEEYFKLLLQYHQPNLRTFMILLSIHSKAGHTKKVEKILELMHTGKGGVEVIQEKLYTPPSDALLDPTDHRLKQNKRLEKNTKWLFPFNEKSLYHLVQAYVANNDKERVKELIMMVREGKQITPYEYQSSETRLHLTIPLAELLMKFYSVQRMIPESFALLGWVEQAQLQCTSTLAFSFFDTFKRELSYRKLKRAGKEVQLRQEQKRRDVKEGVDIEAQLEEERKMRKEEIEGVSGNGSNTSNTTSITLLQQQRSLQPHLQKRHPLAPTIRDPFPLTSGVHSQSSGISRQKTFPVSPLKKAMYTLKPTPLDKMKETVEMEEVCKVMLYQYHFFPSTQLINQYLAYYHENYYPPQTFPDVMLEQVRMMERVWSKEGVEKAAAIAASTSSVTLSSSSTSTPATTVDPAYQLRTSTPTPFVPNSQTYNLLIQARLERKPIRSTTVVTTPSSPSPVAATSLLIDPPISQSDLTMIRSLRSEMITREIPALLPTKIAMMQLMCLEEKWDELYAAFTLLWKGEKLRREMKLREIQKVKPEKGMEEMLKEEEEDGEEEKEEKEDGEADENDKTTLSSIRARTSSITSSTPFTCISLIPIFLTLSQRPTLERVNLFFGIVTQAKDFPLTKSFFQFILTILSERGYSQEIIGLLKIMKMRYTIKPSVNQYNSLLAAMVNQPSNVALDVSAATNATPATAIPSPSSSLTPKQSISNMFQTYELMKLLKIGFNRTTLNILLQGCVKYGELEDGMRLWHWIHWKTEFRPTLAMYTSYLTFLLKHNEIQHALMVLRSQSFKDGLEWTLKECYLVLEWLEQGKLAQVKAKSMSTSPEDVEDQPDVAVALQVTDETGGASLSSNTSSSSSSFDPSIHILSPSQLTLHTSIQSRARSISLRLLAWEKSGGRLSRPGVFEVTSNDLSTLPHTLTSHRSYVSPQARVKYLRTNEEKDDDEVINLTTIPGRMFQEEMVPLLRDIDTFTGEEERRKERERQKKRVKMIEMSQSAKEEQRRKDAQERIKQIQELAKEEGEQKVDEEQQQQSGEKEAENPILILNDNSTPTSTAATDFTIETSIPSSSSLSSPQRERKPVPAGIDPIASAQRKADKAAMKIIKAQRRAERVEAKRLAEETIPFQPTEVARSIQKVLSQLKGKATRTRPLRAVLPTLNHPVMLGEINLSQLHAEKKLDTLSLDQLKAIQTDQKLMAQPAEIVKGRKSHHLQVIETWLQHCGPKAQQIEIEIEQSPSQAAPEAKEQA